MHCSSLWSPKIVAPRQCTHSRLDAVADGKPTTQVRLCSSVSKSCSRSCCARGHYTVLANLSRRDAIAGHSAMQVGCSSPITAIVLIAVYFRLGPHTCPGARFGKGGVAGGSTNQTGFRPCSQPWRLSCSESPRAAPSVRLNNGCACVEAQKSLSHTVAPQHRWSLANINFRNRCVCRCWRR